MSSFPSPPHPPNHAHPPPISTEDVVFVLILVSSSSQFSIRHSSTWMSVMNRPQLCVFFVRTLSTGMWWQRHDPLCHDALHRTTLRRISSFSVGCREHCCYKNKQNLMEGFRQTGHWGIINDFEKIVQGVPLATEPGISLTILPLMRILQRLQTHTTDTFLFISHTMNVILFKFRCKIFIGVRIIKEMPSSVASGTPCDIATTTDTHNRHIPLHFSQNERTPVQISLQNLHWC